MKSFPLATPTQLCPWVLDALQDFPLKRSDLIDHVNEMAKAKGFAVKDRNTIKVALSRLFHSGAIVHVQHGWWGLPGWNKEFLSRSNDAA